MSDVIVVGEWGRGFKTFGPEVRESSAAETPKAWLDDGLEDTYNAWANEDHADLEFMEGLASDGHLGAMAWVAFVETCPNPRWFEYEQPPAKIAKTGPPPWVDEETGMLLGEVIEHRYGWFLWSGVMVGDRLEQYPELAFVATAKAGFEYFVGKGVDMTKLTAYDKETLARFCAC